ncbi:TPA: hypothetical protein ACOVI5_000431 [Klebsiella oxytoca]
MTSKLTRDIIKSEIADFFAGVVEIHTELGGPNTVEEAQNQLTERVLACVPVLDSEPVELPLDYLQGHKDGLEWAAQLAKANHPETGDWLYDDPIELAKAIRKGPDMPPVPTVRDSEPVAIVEPSDYVTAAQLVGEGPARKAVHELYEGALRIGDKLYRHAQQPVVQCPFPCGWDNLNKLAIQDAAFVTLALVAGEPATESIRQAAISNNDRLLKVISACRAAMLQAGNSPVIPEGYVMVPKEPTEAMMLHNSGCQHHAWDDPDCAMRQTRRLIWSHMLTAALREVES